MKRILFVDDEQYVLDDLRVVLHPLRTHWEMVFVDSGEKALSELATSSYDVIVADMRMPGMDGAALLRHVQDRHSSVVRIVLSEHAEMEATLCAATVAHQFLAKPCDAKMLENVVERACQLQALINDNSVRQIVSKVQRLPSPPRLYFELMEILEKEQAGVAEVASVIECDPPMVAKVLQLVNSAFFGLRREVSSIDQAIMYLGTNLIKHLAVVAHVFKAGGRKDAEVALEAVQRHSLIVGSIARRMVDKKMSDDVFIAGILHDIGKVILLSERPQDLALIAARAREENRPMVDIEKEELGVTHAELGAYLLGIWGLPYRVIEATANHHNPARVSQPAGPSVLAAVYTANVLVHEQAQASGGSDPPFVPLDEGYLRRLGLHDRLLEWREITELVMQAFVTGPAQGFA